jgi:hypothetical protein
MKSLYTVPLILATAFTLQSVRVSGQLTTPGARDLEEKFYEARKISTDLVRNYSWDSRIDVTKDGKVMDILIQQEMYGADGKLEKKVLNDQEAKLPSSFLIHQVAEEMKTKMITFMDGLHLFLESYALDDRSKASSFFSKAMIQEIQPGGDILVVANDVIVDGDRLQWWVDPHTFEIIKASVSTVFEGEKVEFTATYKNIPPGLNYMAFAEILVPSKSLMVQLHSYDYLRKSD